MVKFRTNDLRGISGVIGAQTDGLSNAEIEGALKAADISHSSISNLDVNGLFEILLQAQNESGNRRNILAFLRVAIDPANFVNEPQRFAELRERLNGELMLCGLQVQEDGSLSKMNSFSEEERNVLQAFLPGYRFLRRFMSGNIFDV